MPWGADGSVVEDGGYVYVLPLHQIRQVDYFHGALPDEGPVAQMMEDEIDILASEMISTDRDGRTVQAIITLQRRWRTKRLQHAAAPAAAAEPDALHHADTHVASSSTP